MIEHDLRPNAQQKQVINITYCCDRTLFFFCVAFDLDDALLLAFQNILSRENVTNLHAALPTHSTDPRLALGLERRYLHLEGSRCPHRDKTSYKMLVSQPCVCSQPVQLDCRQT